jgi:hypothetical protein
MTLEDRTVYILVLCSIATGITTGLFEDRGARAIGLCVVVITFGCFVISLTSDIVNHLHPELKKTKSQEEPKFREEGPDSW